MSSQAYRVSVTSVIFMDCSVSTRSCCGPYLSVIMLGPVPARDPSLEVLLDLDGQEFTFEPPGYSVKFKVSRVPATPERPHGISYALTLHAPNGMRLVGFDNARLARTGRRSPGTGSPASRGHRLGTTRPYHYSDALQ